MILLVAQFRSRQMSKQKGTTSKSTWLACGLEETRVGGFSLKLDTCLNGGIATQGIAGHCHNSGQGGRPDRIVGRH